MANHEEFITGHIAQIMMKSKYDIDVSSFDGEEIADMINLLIVAQWAKRKTKKI